MDPILIPELQAKLRPLIRDLAQHVLQRLSKDADGEIPSSGLGSLDNVVNFNPKRR